MTQLKGLFYTEQLQVSFRQLNPAQNKQQAGSPQALSPEEKRKKEYHKYDQKAGASDQLHPASTHPHPRVMWRYS